MTHENIVAQTKRWVSEFVVKYYMCPFARAEVERSSIKYHVCESTDMEKVLLIMMEVCQELDKNSDIETSLLILPKGFDDFEIFIDLLAIADELLIQQGYEGTYQLASFHPNYQFGGDVLEDPANYTNRAPYPTMHLLRESSIERVLRHYPSPEQIPERNIDFCRRKGKEWLETNLMRCKEQTESLEISSSKDIATSNT